MKDSAQDARLEASRALSEARGDAFFVACVDWAERLGVRSGAQALTILQARDQGGLQAVVGWPAAETDLTRLTEVVQEALQKRSHALIPKDGLQHLAVPMMTNGKVDLVVALEFPSAARPPAQRIAAIETEARALHVLFWQSQAAANARAKDDLFDVLDLVAVLGGQRDFPAAAIALVNEIRERHGAARVSLGVLKSSGMRDTWAKVRVVAVSDAAHLKASARTVVELSALMEEAIDLETALVWPPAEVEVIQRNADAVDAEAATLEPVPLAHRDYIASNATQGRLFSFPLWSEDAAVGALVIETRDRDDAVGDAKVETAGRLAAALLGPVIAGKHREHALVGGRMLGWVRSGARAVGRGRPTAVAIVLGAALLIGGGMIPVADRVSAEATLFGASQRAVVAPFDGFVGEVLATAGDAVAAGDTLVLMEDEELRLDVSRWTAQYAQFQQERRVALAARDRAEASLLEARIDQALAELTLARLKLERAVVQAPIGGRVVSGDLRQQIGAPVREGDLLFELSPDEGYRADIFVSERDIDRVSKGQTGQLLLSTGGGGQLRFEIVDIRQTATTRDGQNSFVVDAKILDNWAGLRTGLTGTAKIQTGRGPALAVWTRSTRHGLYRWLWAWLP